MDQPTYDPCLPQNETPIKADQNELHKAKPMAKECKQPMASFDLSFTAQEVEPCKYACYKPADTLAGLINNLRSSTATYEALNPPGAYFTDRCYRQQYQNPPPTPPFRPPLKPNLYLGIF